MSQKTLPHACPHRSVSNDGRIVCKMIQSGDNEVSPNLCRECPVKAIGCDHLRFSLKKMASQPILIRYVTGRVEMLNDEPARVTFSRAACTKKVVPVHSPVECAGCALHSGRTEMPAAACEVMPARRGESHPLRPAAMTG